MTFGEIAQADQDADRVDVKVQGSVQARVHVMLNVNVLFLPAIARYVLPLALLVAFAACPSSKTTKAPDKGKPGVQLGYASWYGGKHHGGPTASGEKFNKFALTAAHRSLRMHTRVKVTNKRNGRSVIVRINDRGPYAGKNRIIDLSEAAAQQLGMIEAGVVPVVVELVK